MPLLLLLIFVVQNKSVIGNLPPKTPPHFLEDQYTLGGKIPLEYFYVDDTMNGEGTHFRIKTGYDHLLSQGLPPETLLLKLRKDDWLHFALLNYTEYMSGKRVVVVGSVTPWVETLALALGAASVTTVEYNQLTYGGDTSPGEGVLEGSSKQRLRTVSHKDFEAFYKEETETFDVAFSLSSLDHDGLGRYGDPLNPNGDIEAMQRIRSLLKPGGVMFVTVPVGPDVVVFNLHRRYGPLRLPLLLAGWSVEQRIGWSEEALTEPVNWRQTFEPVFILRKAPTTDERLATEEL